MINQIIDNNPEHHFYFIRYPLGAAGTYLANLISLSPTVSNNFSADNDGIYINEIKKLVLNNTSHYSTHCIISDARWEDVLKNIDYSKNASVHKGHAASFFWRSNELKKIKHKFFILLTFKTEESVKIIQDRELNLFKTNTLQNQYYKEELRFFYNTWFKSDNNSYFDDEINLEIEINQIFERDISQVIEKINDFYHLDIPVKIAQQVHKQWLIKNKKFGAEE